MSPLRERYRRKPRAADLEGWRDNGPQASAGSPANGVTLSAGDTLYVLSRSERCGLPARCKAEAATVCRVVDGALLGTRPPARVVR